MCSTTPKPLARQISITPRGSHGKWAAYLDGADKPLVVSVQPFILAAGSCSPAATIPTPSC
jgi:hypothetical protein